MFAKIDSEMLGIPIDTQTSSWLGTCSAWLQSTRHWVRSLDKNQMGAIVLCFIMAGYYTQDSPRHEPLVDEMSRAQQPQLQPPNMQGNQREPEEE